MLTVAAAIIRNDQNEILICQRGAGGSNAFLWEFPGGKREPGETLEECLMRECYEELDIQIEVDELYDTASYEYPEGALAFSFFNARIISGINVPHVHNEIRWVRPETLGDYHFCPADIEIIKKLQNQE